LVRLDQVVHVHRLEAGKRPIAADGVGADDLQESRRETLVAEAVIRVFGFPDLQDPQVPFVESGRAHDRAGRNLLAELSRQPPWRPLRF
jgi:hypothetical protein